VFPDGRLGRLDQQLAAGVAAEGPAEEVEPLGEVHDPGLVLVQRQAPFRQPSLQPFPYALGLLSGETAGHKIVGVPDRNRGVIPRTVGVVAVAVADSGGLLKAVQRDIQQDGADDPALWSTFLRGRESLTRLEHPSLQPPGDHVPGGERPELG
jgi:hypothetical protein